jgi:hypothetical protein
MPASSSVPPTILLTALVAACGPAAHGILSFCSDEALPPVEAPADAAPTYHQDIAPLVAARCARCHEAGGLAPFPLTTYEQVRGQRAAMLASMQAGEMPPWQAAPCCAAYRHDFSVSPEQVALFARWHRNGAPEGDPTTPRELPKAGGLTRVDLTVTMAAPYAPLPSRGSTDDVRCFLVDWPVPTEAYVRGFEVRPGQRAIVHHLILATVAGDDLAKAKERDGKDGRPGFPCGGGAGSIKTTAVLGGGLGASEAPEGYGVRVAPGSKLLLNIHYSTASFGKAAPPADQTSVDLMLASSGKRLQSIVVTNLAWLVGDSMKVRAGDPDAIFYWRFRPTVFTGGRPVHVFAAHPHMHTFGSRFQLAILRSDGTRDCLLEIPHWEFGWEQSYWLAEPKRLDPKDQLVIECHFDNSEARQPIVDGVRQKPRDFAWGGNNQDMCAGFLAFAPVE